MSDGLTRSEKFIAELCKRAFLRLWTHPNPIGKKGKELCDCLVVCGHHIIIISVKECDYKSTGDLIGWERWEKAAITKSAAQIWGAERFLAKASFVERADGRKLRLPKAHERIFHRISVSLGGKGRVPLKWGDLGHGFVHVIDEFSVGVIFGELDTISDFIHYLGEVENLYSRNVQLIFNGGGQEDLLGAYINNGCSLDFRNSDGDNPDLLTIGDGIWSKYAGSVDFRERKNAISASYFWDRLIEEYTRDLLTDGMFDMHSKKISKNELALIEMARQPRMYRASLAEAFTEIVDKPELKIRARAVRAFNQVAFVFMLAPSSDREARYEELGMRCIVVRNYAPNITTVIGIATDRPGSSEIGYSSDIFYLHTPILNAEYSQMASKMRYELGYFKNLNFDAWELS